MSRQLLLGLFMLGLSQVMMAVTPSADSIFVTRLLAKVDSLPAHENKVLFLAKGFLGIPYAAGTLETYPVEHLVVRTDSVDCTTFVENVLALYLAHCSQGSAATFDTFTKSLQTIRYRDGILDGYPSRLHYFSDWIYDNQRKGIVREVTQESPHAIRKVDLNFMSTHASLYPFLANDEKAVTTMKSVESRWLNFQMPYIPKEKLNLSSEVLNINDGDILTLVTTINGLDVVHVGFACWVEGQLHLLHASSAKHHVLLDPLTLFHYSKNKKAHLGIRVIRIIDQ